MIRNNKKTNKFVTVISIFAAVVVLSTTVFASGILTDLTTDDYTVEITNNGEKIELANKPFIESGEVYVPLRETLEKAMPNDNGIVDIQWDNGTVDVIVAYYQGMSGKYQFKIGGQFVKLQHISYEDYKNNSISKSDVVTSIKLQSQSPILKNSTTYVTLRYVNYMLYGYTNRRDEMDYIIYDKNGEIIAAESNPIKSGKKLIDYYEYNTPEFTLSRFFRFFSEEQFETMKNYCTQNCIDTYFKDNSVFGMEKASLVEMNIAPTEYLKSSNDFNVFVTVNMTPSEISVFDPKENSTSFYVILQRVGETYLIDGFSTSI